ncbi:MAG TPA: ATP-binding cassette domain-containing protein, partial [Oscillospiraceae bacterium]|nr:ATP-binding cassette domain-containing protein [Oscillospiraceae bacterium]
MAVLSVHNLKMSFGERVLFSEASFEIGDKDRVGLVGANGSGKTTLFKLIIGELEASEGTVTKGRHIKLGYMQQHVGSGDEKSLYDDMLCVFDYLMDMEAELEALAQAIDQNPPNINELIDRQHRLSEDFEREGGLTFRSRARSALIGLGFSEDDFGLPVKKLSGGQ